ncbi:hypothetical protein LH490_27680, partial [Klebsiella pneumoniae]|nr:hypothetical protein [Klebsiella pneumoniae]
YYPGTADIPEGVAPNIRNRSFTIRAVVDVAAADASGVIVAQGSRFGEHSLFLKGGTLHYSYNFLGIDETQFVSADPIASGQHAITVEFAKEGEDPPAVANGTVTVTVDDVEVASGQLRTQPGKFSLAGEG